MAKLGLVASSVYPSGLALAVISNATTPPAPGRLSTTTCWCHRSDSFLPMIRAATSVPPPGLKPTSSRTGLRGYEARAVAAGVCAAGATLATTHDSAAAAKRDKRPQLL